MIPQICPICNRTAIKPVLEEIQVSARVSGNMRAVSGLAAFICATEGHIFFVRRSDLQSDEQVAMSA